MALLDKCSSVDDEVLSCDKISMGDESVYCLCDIFGYCNFLKGSISGKFVDMAGSSFYPAGKYDTGATPITLTSGASTLARDFVMLISAALLAA